LISIQIDQAEVKQLAREKIAELVKEVDAEYIFWDTTELRRRTCMSWNTIQDTFFFNPDFPKHKIGGKWYFPAKATREFLIKWIEGQG